MATQRLDDQFHHQQNETPEQSHQGFASGATAQAVADRLTGDTSHTQQHTVPPQATQAPVSQTQQDNTYGVGTGPQVLSTSGELETLCGPLLNYKHMSNVNSGTPMWHGTVLIVTTAGQKPGDLSVRCLGAIGNSQGSGASNERPITSPAVKLYEDPGKAFFRYELALPFQGFEAKWEYHVPSIRYVGAGKRAGDPSTQTFYVPSASQSMRILFHSCNGFSVGTDVDAWSGPALWNDVLRVHERRPFHVMIGGGDQIYNDSVRVDGPLRPWTDIANPHKRREYPFNEEMRSKCDEFYFQNYVKWYSAEPFSAANGQIAQINIWDDHDIIDGFGSYTDRFMRCAVFRGIGGVAHKYYMLFQHHIAPPKSTFTTDAPKTTHVGANGTPADPVQLKDTFVISEAREDESFIIGPKPGPYVEERSRSIYCQLGARVAFMGLDARTERTRHQINYPETYDIFFNRAAKELNANKNIKHLILLLGVPIAYPRLQWLENIFSSPLMGPLRFLNKRFGVGGNFFNSFDGNVDLLDDLDDHYTAHQHKKERKELILRLQELAKQHSIRISILGGDVHLAAVGRFYSNPKLGIPAERDWRYMPNIISSAITNKPPPQAVANLLARRNKIHHLDHDTDETLLEIFDRDPGLGNGNGNGNGNGKIAKKTADSNHCTMPSRNYAIICESHTVHDSDVGAPTNGAANGATTVTPIDPKANPRQPIHAGEQDAGTAHPASGGIESTGLCGTYGLDVTIRVEISPSDREGHTEGYGFAVPGLESGAYAQQGQTW